LGAILLETLQSGEIVLNREMSIQGKNGKLVPVGVSTSILKDAADRPTGAIAIFTDLSEIRHLESQIIRSEKLASIGQLAAGVSHELRNPLGSISGYAELIQERVQTDDDVVKRGLDTIISESERSKHIIERLLGYARLREPSLETVDINSIIEDTLPLIGHQLMQDNVSLVKEYGSLLPHVRVDVEQMKEVFINLILNSHQAMPDGGTLHIVTGFRDDSIVIRVADEGHGIPEDHLNRLFDPFFTTKDGGTGLGLPTAYRIVERHGGSIDVESVLGKGSTFTIRLKAATNLEEPQTPLTREAGGA
jgi:signal transduction histidine kinase